MEIKNTDDSAAGCSRPLKGCAVIAGLIIISLIGLLIYMRQNPTIDSIIECRSNMMEVGQAIKRYHDVNRKYPDDLLVIKEEYLAVPSLLRCPVDEDKEGVSSYVYHRPSDDSAEKYIMLECSRHNLGKDLPLGKMVLYKNGDVEFIQPKAEQDKK